MREGLDISDIEASTKIRAKYLRALENEEWDLLPGPTFVKSFLRTYAEALGLDSRMLLEEYKLRYERFEDYDTRAASQRTPGPAAGRERRPPRRRNPARWIFIAAAVMVVIIVIALLDSGSSPKKDTTTTVGAGAPQTTTSNASTTTATTASITKVSTAGGGRSVTLQVVPTGSVYVCLISHGKRLINGQVLEVGHPSASYHSTSYLLSLGNGNARLRVGSTNVAVPDNGKPIGYSISRKGARVLAAANRPNCG